MERVRLLIVDDHAMFRDGLRAVLTYQTDLIVVGEAGDAETAFRLTQELQPDVVLMDLCLPRRDGVAAIREILAHYPATKIIALTMYQDDDLIAGALQAGASGYVLKDAHAADLIQAIHDVVSGGAAIDPAVASRVLNHYRRLAGEGAGQLKHSLSARDLEMLHMLAAGASNREISARLCLSIQTVKNSLSEIYHTLGASNRTEAVASAMHQGLIRSSE